MECSSGQPAAASPFAPRMLGSTESMEKKSGSELDYKMLEDLYSKAFTEQVGKPRHIRLIKGIGVYADGSESEEVLYELARMKDNSVGFLYKNWRFMSTEHEASLLPPVARSRVPWILTTTADGIIFGNFIDKKSFYVHNKDVPNAFLVHSREGWLLFLSLLGEKRRDCRMILLNPSSGETFTMPPAQRGLCAAIPKASFTMREGRPDLVIFPRAIGHNIEILLARPGDETWEVHTATVFSRHMALYDSLLCARSLYCVFDEGCVVMAFHLDGHYWSTYNKIRIGPYLLEFEGKVLSVCPPVSYEADGCENFFAKELIIHRNEASLVKLNDIELSNKSWFLGKSQSFCARMMGQKVYQFSYAPQWDVEFNGEILHCVHYHDLLKKKFRKLTADAFRYEYGWVDLGGVMVTRYPKTRA